MTIQVYIHAAEAVDQYYTYYARRLRELSAKDLASSTTTQVNAGKASSHLRRRRQT